MTRFLGFETACESIGGRRLRRARFDRRSALPVSAACVVGNGIREVLSSALGQAVRLRVMEPLLPQERAWETIFAGAQVFLVRGPLSNAAIVLRNPDAVALAGAAFGEAASYERPLSPIEDHVLSRIVRRLAATLAPVCGAAEHLHVEKCSERMAFLTYFEMLLDGPFDARIGIALAREPLPACGRGLSIEDLMDVKLELDVEFASAEIEARSLLLLQPDMTLPMQTKVGAPAALKLDGRIVARGECGVLGERNAFVVSGSPKGGEF